MTCHNTKDSISGVLCRGWIVPGTQWWSSHEAITGGGLEEQRMPHKCYNCAFENKGVKDPIKLVELLAYCVSCGEGPSEVDNVRN